MPCEQGHLHFEPSHGLVEVINPDTGVASEPGHPGTLVVTPFPPFRETTLLLRYDTQDVVRVVPEPPTCHLRHLPATTGLLGKLGLAVRHDEGWTYPREVMEALETVEAVPLPARFGMEAVPSGVSVEVVVRERSVVAEREIERSLLDHGVPLAGLRLVTDPAELRRPYPLRCDLRELGFAAPQPSPVEVPRW
jgi:hypothetical protein